MYAVVRTKEIWRAGQMKLSGNTVLITGGATGIGLAAAESFLKCGSEVLICGRSRDTLKAAKSRFPQLHIRVCDVTVPRSRAGLIRWATSHFRSLNVLVNNAGIQHSVDFTRGPRDLPQADAEIATNLSAPIHLSASLIPCLRRRRKAAIVFISSGLAFTPLAGVPVYCATKAAVHSLSMSLRHQLRHTRIKVFEIAPPMVATSLGGRRRSAEELEFCMSAEEVAQGILRALKRDEYEVALGSAAGLYRRRDAMFNDMNR
jgi:uncharacterized oxidoreductase